MDGQRAAEDATDLSISERGERAVLVLQGGGALGPYQAGVYEELSAGGVAPDWIAGISIGAVNAALIAGNKPGDRLGALQEFWRRVSSTLAWPRLDLGDAHRRLLNEFSAGWAVLFGLPGFFTPRFPSAWFQPPGSAAALSHYDTAPLRRTLLELVDFELLNSGATRLSVGAVNVRTGNFTYFDSARQAIGPEHVMASGALPPGFPPVEIDGEHYWDGGLVSNTPLQYVLDEDEMGAAAARDLLVFQVDLFSAAGPMPRSLLEVEERAKDIRFSSRTRLGTDLFKRQRRTHEAMRRVLAKLPADLADDPDVKAARDLAGEDAATIVHLIHRRKHYDSQSKDYEFSRQSVVDHWEAGRTDVRRTFRHPGWRTRPQPGAGGITVLDLTRDA